MPVYMDEQRGTWTISYRYIDHHGVRKRFTKRGFKTKRDALDFERRHRTMESCDMEMKFGDFVKIYMSDIEARVRRQTFLTKRNIIETKILPYFEDMQINRIEARDVVRWQNSIMQQRTKNGKPFSPVYLKTIHNQLTAIFNHAVNLYDLKINPARKAGSMGKKKGGEKKFWTQEEYLKFAACIMDDPETFYACEILYWCGLRVSELLALRPMDFDFEKSTLQVVRGLHRIEKQDVIGETKSDKSYRTVVMPDLVAEEIQEFIRMQFGISTDDRIFSISAVVLRDRVSKWSSIAGVKRITVHEFRHSHISLLIELGFSALAIADRVGHETEEITNGYAHLFPSKQNQMAEQLSIVRGEL